MCDSFTSVSIPKSASKEVTIVLPITYVNSDYTWVGTANSAGVVVTTSSRLASQITFKAFNSRTDGSASLTRCQIIVVGY